MRNIVLIFLLSWFACDTFAQTQLLGSPTTLVKNRGAFMSDSLLYIPKRTKLPSDTGAIRYAIADSTVYVWTGSQWRSVSISSGVYVPYTGATADVDLGNFSLNAKSMHIKGTGGQGHLGLKHQNAVPSLSASESGLYANVTGDLAWQNDNLYASTFKTSNQTASRTYTFENKSYTLGDSADIAARVKYTDTSSMLTPYLRKVDTSAMLSVYLRKVDTATMVAPYLRKVDTSAMLSSYLRKVDTATMLSPYLRKIDTLTMLSPYVRAAGYGLTKSGQSLLVDTAAIATRARVQKAVDSLGGVISTGVTGTGTTNYVTKFTGTSTVGNSQIFDNGTSVGIGTTSPSLANNSAIKELTLTKSGEATNIAQMNLQGDRSGDGAVVTRVGTISAWQTTNEITRINFNRHNANNSGSIDLLTDNAGGGLTTRLRVQPDGEVLVNSTSDAGAYALQVAGSIYNTTSAALATSSGTFMVGTTTANGKLHVEGTAGGSGAAITTNSSASNIFLKSFINNASDIAFDNNSGNYDIYVGGSQRTRIKTDGEYLVGSSTDQGAYILQVTGAVYTSSSIITGAPSGGTAKPFKIGAAATVSPTSPNRTIEIEIDGTTYYIHAKTTNN